MPRSRWTDALGPLVLGHALAYPAAFVSAFAGIPVAILAQSARIAAVEEREAVEFLLRQVAWPAVAVFLGIHLASLPWAFGKDRRRGARVFYAITAAVFGIAIVVGGVFWAKLFLL